jgi:hypothetical protein
MSILGFLVWGVAAMALTSLVGAILTLDLGLGFLAGVLAIAFAIMHSVDKARTARAQREVVK